MPLEKKEKILIVDDEQEACDTLKRILERHDYSAVTAKDGEEGLALVNAQPDIDIIFADIFMPKMGGLEFLQLVRQSNPEAEVIIITGHSNLELSMEAVRCGASGYLLKPLQTGEILDELNRASMRIKERAEIMKKIQPEK